MKVNILDENGAIVNTIVVGTVGELASLGITRYSLVDETPKHPIDLTALAARKLAEVNTAATTVANTLTAGYPEFEKLTWADQKREALAWVADNTVATPYLDTLAAFRGISRQEYIEKTVSKVQLFQIASAKLVGQRQYYEDQIKIALAAGNVDAINSITPEFVL